MASTENALAYSSLNKFQFDIGCDFIGLLPVSLGHRIFDMGCGTGELSTLLAEMVGSDGEVVAVDPDEARITVANATLLNTVNGVNVKFAVGDSETGFFRDGEEYYDLYFSNFAFQWVKPERRRKFFEKSYQCLKRGGIIAIQVPVKSTQLASHKLVESSKCSSRLSFIDQEEFHEFLHHAGFSHVKTKHYDHTTYYDSYKSFSAWWKATFHCDLNDVEPKILKQFISKNVQVDGRVQLVVASLRITAVKI